MKLTPEQDAADTYLGSRADMLRIAGNGVVWQQAAHAFSQLLERITI